VTYRFRKAGKDDQNTYFHGLQCPFMATDDQQTNTISSVPQGNQDDPDPNVQIVDMGKTFGEIVACEDINIDIAMDEFVVFLGPSGCGKTTTLRCIAGLERPDEGRILIDGEDVTYTEPKDKNVAFVFQNITLFPHMNVRRNIRFGLDMKTDLSKDEKNERVEDVAEMLGIETMLDRKPAELSGGQQQRVSLGRAMVMEPEAFLLDEPFSALDANLRDQMRIEVKKLQRKLETTMIFVTHDQEEAMTLGDRIVVMNEGRIQQVGSPYEIYNDPNSLFIAEFIGSPSVNTFDCVVAEGDGLTLENELFSVTLSEERAEQFDGASGDRVVLSIRPEYLELDGEDVLFEADLTVIEPHGNRDAVYLDADGHEVTAVTSQHQIDATVNSVDITFDTERLWLFDPSGDRLL
jgi:multiple sugar transport system ATP-binding protein